jgi:hypothetical protein
MNTNGKIAELFFQIWLMRQGFAAQIPISETSPHDIVWNAGGGNWRTAQVKKAYVRKGATLPMVDLRRSDKERTRYTTADADYLTAVVFPDSANNEPGRLWLIPIECLADRSQITLDDTWSIFERKLF